MSFRGSQWNLQDFPYRLVFQDFFDPRNFVFFRLVLFIEQEGFHSSLFYLWRINRINSERLIIIAFVLKNFYQNRGNKTKGFFFFWTSLLLRYGSSFLNQGLFFPTSSPLLPSSSSWSNSKKKKLSGWVEKMSN